MRGVKAIFLATACAFAPLSAHAQEFVYDPYEGFNRELFGVHQTLDDHVFEPVARGYRAATPQPLRTGVKNFLRNLSAPVTFANDLLQGEGARAGTTLARFGINSTVGVLGLFDPATDMGFESHSEDFGQTLAVWGVPAGPYFFVPGFGPTTVRDGAGRIVDLAFNPLSWANFDGANETRVGLALTTAVSTRENVIEAIEDLEANSLDPYVSYRTTYGLFRYSAVQNGRREVEDLPEFEAMPEEYPDDAEGDAEIPAPAEPAPELEHQPQPATPIVSSYTVGELQ